MSNAQRAMWCFLLITLAGPLIGAAALVLTAAGRAMMDGADPLSAVSMAGKIAIQSFVVGSFVAGIAAAGLAALVALRSTFGFLEAAIAGVAAFMIVAISSGVVASVLLTALAFLSACVAIVCRALLVHIKVLPGP